MKKLFIQTARTTIRNLELKDLADFHLYRSNPEVTKYQSFNPMTLEQAKEFILENAKNHFGKAGEWVQFGIENRNTGQLIGDCAIKLDQHDTRIAEIGITLSHLQQRQGFAKEALIGVLTFLFESHHTHRVVAIVDALNTASIELMKSINFRQEGHFIENFFSKGSWSSEYQFALLKREWEKR
jgi:[ribosomal protein S5]-alanine N-acetyltransferase